MSAELTTLLAGLGSTPDEVADALRGRGIRGIPHACCGCPIAALLADVGGDVHPIVDGSIAIVGLLGQKERLPLPTPVALFIERFDAGYYADLVLRGAP